MRGKGGRMGERSGGVRVRGRGVGGEEWGGGRLVGKGCEGTAD